MGLGNFGRITGECLFDKVYRVWPKIRYQCTSGGSQM